MESLKWLAPINYMLDSIIYLTMIILFAFLRRNRQNDYFPMFRLFYKGILALCLGGIANSAYFGIARFHLASGNTKLFDEMSSPLPYILIKGMAMLGTLIMFVYFYTIFIRYKSHIVGLNIRKLRELTARLDENDLQ